MDTAKTSSVPPYMSQVQYILSPLIVLYIHYVAVQKNRIFLHKLIEKCQVIFFEKLAARYEGTTTNVLCSSTYAPILCVHR